MGSVLKALILASALAVVPISKAQAITYTDWSNMTRITIDTNRTNIYIVVSVPNPAGCASSDRVVLPATTGNYDAMTASAMTALWRYGDG